MKKLALLIGVGLVAVSVSAQARIRPIRPIVPIVPVNPVIPVVPINPVVPVVPINPVIPVVPINPVVPVVPVQPGPRNVDWQNMGVVPYVGNGYVTEREDLGLTRADWIKFRVPARCAVSLRGFRLTDDRNRNIRVGRTLRWTDGLYHYQAARIGRNGRTEVREVRLSLYSPLHYFNNSDCGVRIYLGEDVRW